MTFLSAKSVVGLTLVFAFVIGHASSQIPILNIPGFNIPGFNVSGWNTVGLAQQPEKICGEDRFECRNGECIYENLVCDGRVNCADQSDETRAECSKPSRTCKNGAFRCDYGACVPQNATCNGIKDCADNSDELLDECPKPYRYVLLLLKLYNGTSNPAVTSTQSTIDRAEVPRPQLSLATNLTSTESSETSTTTLRLTEKPTSNITTTISPEYPDDASNEGRIFCSSPPQPDYGTYVVDSYYNRLTRQFLWEDKNYYDGLTPAMVYVGVKLYYICDDGYSAKNYPLAECLSTGKWSRTPVCREEEDQITQGPRFCPIEEPITEPPLKSDPELSSESSAPYCVVPLQPFHGHWVAKGCDHRFSEIFEGDKFEIDYLLHFKCESRYSAKEYPVPRCLSTGEFSRTPVCKRVEEKTPTDANSDVIPEYEEPESGERLYECESTELFCLAPPEPANGYRVIINYCDQILGCNDCFKYKYCNIPNGTKLALNTVLYYRCDLGYDTEEYPLPRCLPTGEWSRTPVCTKVEGFIFDEDGIDEDEDDLYFQVMKIFSRSKKAMGQPNCGK